MGNFQAYDQNYNDWKGWDNKTFSRYSKSEEKLYEKILKELQLKNKSSRKLKVLEIGFGNGSLLGYGTNKGWDIEGTEINKKLITIAMNKGYKVNNCENTKDYLDDNFDLVFAFDVMEHINTDDQIDFLVEIKRIMTNDGYFIARFPNGDSPFSLPYQNGDITHVASIGSYKVLQLAKSSGLTVTYIGGEIKPIISNNIIKTIILAISHYTIYFTNYFIRKIFFRDSFVDFISCNMMIILKK